MIESIDYNNIQMLSSNQGKVMNLITQHPKEQEKFIVNEQTIEHMQTYHGNYCFISICGDFRSGKSFLINSLFFDYAAFQTSSTTSSCTKGIKIWSEPILRNGVYIWIVDTEGFGSIEKDSSYDGKIFLMNFLISNVILYNSFGAIDENSINKLAMICREAKVLDQSISESKFYWVLRDFSLEMIDKSGRELTSDQYLQECLKEHSNNQNRSEKQFLRNLFKQRHCVALIRPLIDESKLNNIQELNKINLREEFKQEIAKLYESLIRDSQCKMIKGIKIGHHNIKILINDFVATINKGTIDCNLNCTYQKIIEYEQTLKRQSILDQVNVKIEALRKILPVQKHHITYLRQQANEILTVQLRQLQRFSSQSSLQLMAIETSDEVNTAITALQKENKEKLSDQIKDYLYRQLIELYPKLIALNYHSFQSKFTEIFSKLREDYQIKYDPYLPQEHFLENNYYQFIEKQEKKVFFELVKRWRSAQKEIQEKGEEIKRGKRFLEEEVRKLKEEKERLLKSQDQSRREESKNLQKMKEDIEETFKEEVRVIARNYEAQLHQLSEKHQQQISNLKQELETLEEQKYKLRSQIQYERQSLLEKLTLERQRAELMNLKWQQAKSNHEMQQQQRRNSYDNKIKIAQIKYNQLQTSLSNERRKYQMISEQRKLEENRLLQDLAQKNYKIDCLTEQLIHLEEKYKEQLQRILTEQKDIVCKSLSAKINEYQYKCRTYENKLQEYAKIASEKLYYEQRNEQLQMESRQLKTALEEEQDLASTLANRLKKNESQLEDKLAFIGTLKEQHQKQISLLNEDAANSKNFMKQMEQRHTQEIEWQKNKLQNSLKDQSSSLTQKYEEIIENNRNVAEQKFQKERSQLKEIIKNNYDEVENLKITIVTLSSQIEKIYEILARVLNQNTNFQGSLRGESERSRCNSYNLTDIAESPEEYSDKLHSATKNQRLLKSTEFIAEEIQEMFKGMRQEIIFLNKDRLTIKEELKSNIDELDSYEKTISKVKNQNKNYRAEHEELKRKMTNHETITKELSHYKERTEALEKENSQLRRQNQLKQQLFSSREQNFKQNSLMYKESISNLTEQIKVLTMKVRDLTESNQTYESELQRFRIWATEVKTKSHVPQQADEMSVGKIKDLQDEIKILAKKLQESKMQRIEKTNKKEVSLYSPMLHENRINEIQSLRAQNQLLYQKLEQMEAQMKAIQEKKHSKLRQSQYEQSRYSSLKEQMQAYKRRTKETISVLQSQLELYQEENKQLKKQFLELQNNLNHNFDLTCRVKDQQIAQLRQQKQSQLDYLNKKIQNLQENLNNKTFEADKRIAQADLRFQQYRDQLQKQHNRIILQGERHRLKYEHLLKVNGQLIKQTESLKSKAHQITIKQKYKSKMSSLFND